MGSEQGGTGTPGRRSGGAPDRRLTDLWRLGPSEVISLVGAGGKSSLMEALAVDYEAEGACVVLTTTAKIRAPLSRTLITASDKDALVKAVSLRLADVAAAAGSRALDSRSGCSPVVGRGLTPDGKVEGLPPDWVRALRDIEGVAGVVVEADGSLGLPLKAAAEWEPVVPACSSLVVSVAGLDAQGAPLDDRHVHRAPLLATALGLREGSRMSPVDVLRAATAYETSVPRSAGFLVFLNKADLREPEPSLVSACAESAWEVWCGSAAPTVPIRDSTSTPGDPGASEGRRFRRLDLSPQSGGVPAVVLAAGLGTRMGGPKVTASFGDGTVVGRVVRSVLESRVFSEVVVVAGPDGRGVERAADFEVSRLGARGEGTSTVVRVERNESPEEGMASSLRVGVGTLQHPAGVTVLLGDQPLVEPRTLECILRTAAGAPRAAAVGLSAIPGGLPGPPVFLHRSLVPRVLDLRGDQGARGLIETHAQSAIALRVDPDEIIDVDRPGELERARGLLEGQ